MQGFVGCRCRSDAQGAGGHIVGVVVRQGDVVRVEVVRQVGRDVVLERVSESDGQRECRLHWRGEEQCCARWVNEVDQCDDGIDCQERGECLDLEAALVVVVEQVGEGTSVGDEVAVRRGCVVGCPAVVACGPHTFGVCGALLDDGIWIELQDGT